MAINVRISGNSGATQQRVSAPTIFLGSSGSLAEANAAFIQANAAFIQANSAYGVANTSIQVTGGEITGNLRVDGIIFGNVYVVDAGTF